MKNNLLLITASLLAAAFSIHAQILSNGTLTMGSDDFNISKGVEHIGLGEVFVVVIAAGPRGEQVAGVEGGVCWGS